MVWGKIKWTICYSKSKDERADDEHAPQLPFPRKEGALIRLKKLVELLQEPGNSFSVRRVALQKLRAKGPNKLPARQAMLPGK